MRAIVTSKNWWLLTALCYTTLLGAGCVTRTLLIETEPAGAEVILNEQNMGKTPIAIPFRQYGLYRIELSHADYDRKITELNLKAPWYCRFPLGLFSELLWPAVIRDTHYASFKLSKKPLPSREELLKNADAATSAPKEITPDNIAK